MAARLEVEIDGVNTGLKKTLNESLSELSRFSNALKIKPDGVNSLNASLATTRSLLQDVANLSASARGSLGGIGGGGSGTQNQTQELNAARVATENYRTESARLASELQALRLQTAQSRTSTTAAAGSYREAQQRLTALGRSIREAENGFRSTNPAIQGQIREYRRLNDQLQEFDSTMGNNQRRVGNYERALSGVKGTLLSLAAGAFSIGAITNFGRQVIAVTAEFEKFRAVLGNTLGSTALADLKLKELQDFASKTPFAINELTGAFVKLANSGFKPTAGQMTSLGDLASSTGKSFDQLAEAILDAQTGEFERLKEFGVRAKDAGDQVIFTYKGVQTTVEKTSSAIRDYITNLGNAVGVSGSMAKISQTLGGQISNLGDNWDQMLLSVGSNTTGIFNKAISVMNKALEKITQYNEELNIVEKNNLGSDFGNQLNRALNPFAGKGATDIELAAFSIKTASKNVGELVSKALSGAKSIGDFSKALVELKKQGDAALTDPSVGKKGAELTAKTRKGIKNEYQNGVQAIIDARNNFIAEAGNTGGANFGTSKTDKKGFSLTDTMDQLRKAIELTGVQFQSTFDERNNAKIAAYQSAINSVTNALGAQSEVVKNLQKEQQKLFQLTPVKEVSAVNPETKKALEKAASELTITGKVEIPNLFDKEAAQIAENARRQLNGAVSQFGNNFFNVLTSINQRADRSFTSIIGSIGESLSGMLQDTFNNQLSGILQQFVSGVGISATQAVAGLAGIAGGIISGVTKKTDIAGQTAGGALTGAASGAIAGSVVPGLGTAAGAIIGGVVGALGGLLGANKAQKEARELQKRQLEEAKKQTDLLRQNATLFTSAIIGRMTDQGILTNVDINATGQLIATVNGKQIDFVLGRTNNSRG